MTEPLDWARVPADVLQRDVRVQRNIATWIDLQERAGRVVKRRLTDGEATFEATAAPLRTLSLDQLEMPTIFSQIARLQARGTQRPWRTASVREALGVPSIFRAASLIANTTGSLSMRALRNEVEMDPQERPRIIIRPDPNKTPRDFFRDTAWNMGRYGEAWWYVTKRDGDDVAQSLFNVPDPREVQVEDDPADPIRPHITWRLLSTRDGTLKREDMRLLTFLPDDTGLRGVGPLQLCGAAVSVSVESQEWAANFYAAGGYPNIWIKVAGVLGGDEDEMSTEEQIEAGALTEAQRIKNEWISTAPNTPKVTDESIADIKVFEPNPSGAQMLDARDYQNGDAARMFGIPGTILDYYRSGASLTYQNLDDEFIKWVRLGLRPGYLEPIEQAMSDLLTRSIVARFQTESFEAPNVKTRFEVYKSAVEVFGPEEGAQYARKREGLAPGDVENAPVPFARPVAVPRIAASREVRCDGRHPDRAGRCGKLLSRGGAYVGTCPRCKKSFAAA